MCNAVKKEQAQIEPNSPSFILIRLRTCRRGNVYAQIAIGTYDLFIRVQIEAIKLCGRC